MSHIDEPRDLNQ